MCLRLDWSGDIFTAWRCIHRREHTADSIRAEKGRSAWHPAPSPRHVEDMMRQMQSSRGLRTHPWYYRKVNMKARHVYFSDEPPPVLPSHPAAAYSAPSSGASRLPFTPRHTRSFSQAHARRPFND